MGTVTDSFDWRRKARTTRTVDRTVMTWAGRGLPRREELAWAAGFFDGEGSVSKYTTRRGDKEYTYLQMNCPQVEREVLDRFLAAVGVGVVYGPYGFQKYAPPGSVWKPHWMWNARGFEQVQQVIATLWPWLGTVKREQARRLLIEARGMAA
jgi:hypothetical protein